MVALRMAAGSCLLLLGGWASAAMAQSAPGRDAASYRRISAVAELPQAGRPVLFEWTGSPWGPGEVNREKIATDRPDFTEASSTVGLGTTQLELGYTFSFGTAEGVYRREHSWGEPLVRMGMLADWLEFRVGLFPCGGTTIDGPNRDPFRGLEDLYLGAKLGLFAQSGWFPEVAVLPQMAVPTGSRDLTAGRVLPGVNLLYGWDVGDDWKLGGSTQFNRAVDDDRELFTEWAQSITVGRSLTERLAGYCEWFAFVPDGASVARTEHYLNTGLTLLLSDDVQWDIRAGHGLSEAARDWFVGTGISIRFR